jgi:hypothetical protein
MIAIRESIFIQKKVKLVIRIINKCIIWHFSMNIFQTQVLVCALNCWGHFMVGVYAPAHTVPFVLSFFHCALLFIAGQRICSEQVSEAREMAKGGVTTATVMLRSQQPTSSAATETHNQSQKNK